MKRRPQQISVLRKKQDTAEFHHLLVPVLLCTLIFMELLILPWDITIHHQPLPSPVGCWSAECPPVPLTNLAHWSWNEAEIMVYQVKQARKLLSQILSSTVLGERYKNERNEETSYLDPWRAAVHRVAKSRTLTDWTELKRMKTQDDRVGENATNFIKAFIK